MVQVNSSLVKNYGAMHPIIEGKIIEQKGGSFLVSWDNGEIGSVPFKDINYGRSANGSPIGILPLDVFMAL